MHAHLALLEELPLEELSKNGSIDMEIERIRHICVVALPYAL